VQAGHNVNQGQQAQAAAGHEGAEEDFLSFSWGGRTDRYVPHDFIYPSCSVRMIWNLWFHGDLEKKIRPYRHLREMTPVNHVQDLQTKVQRVLSYKTEQVIQSMEAFADSNDIDFNVDTIEAADTTFDATYNRFLKSVFSERDVIHRGTTKSFATVANQIMKNRKNVRGEAPMAVDDNHDGNSSSSSSSSRSSSSSSSSSSDNDSDSDDDSSGVLPRPSTNSGSSSYYSVLLSFTV
jgi:hypothetical protein